MHEDQRSQGDARGYSWQTFERGNEVALRHGAYSERAIAARADDVHTRLLEVAPWLNQEHYSPALARYLRAAAREELLQASIDTIVADKGPAAVPARTWEQATAAARLAAQLGSSLGLDPTGHARLKAMTGQAQVVEHTLADLAASGREARLAAEARFATTASVRPPEALEPAAEPSTTPEPSDDPSGAVT